jgi:outer membrane protein assembly factor BamB
MDLSEFWRALEDPRKNILIMQALLGACLVLIAVALIARGLQKKRPLGRGASTMVGLTAMVLGVAGVGLITVTVVDARRPAGPSGAEMAESFAAQPDAENAEELQKLEKADLAVAKPQKTDRQDWPQWRGQERDGVCRETGLRLDWDKGEPPVVWKQPIGRGYSQVAVADGRLYTMDQQGNEERILCLDAATGKELWSHRYAIKSQPSYSGPRATPTITDGKVYTVGSTGTFLCLDAKVQDADRRVLWQHELLGEFQAAMPGWGVASSPLIEGDLVIVQPGGKKGSVVAFDRRTGKVVWTSLDDGSGYSSPVAATIGGVRQIVVFTGIAAAGLRASDGKKLWYYPWHTQFDANIATPIVAGDYVFISSDYGTGCALLHVVGTDGSFKAEEVYAKRNKLMRNHHSTCVLADGYLYGFDDSLLKCVDLRKGTEKWSSRKFEKGCVLWADGHLIVLGEGGTLGTVKATPEEFRLTGTINEALQGPECWALPSVSGGRLYLRDHHHVVCRNLK